MSKFQELINAETPVLVDFFATWCGPCKVMAPVLQQVAGKIGDSAKIIKVDIDKNQQAAATYQIRGVPTFIIFKNGKQLWRQSGVVPEAVLLQQLNAAKSL
jgi:thioredoxin 1